MSGTFTHRTGRGQQGFDTGAHEALQNQDLGDGTFEETHNIGSTTRSFDINLPRDHHVDRNPTKAFTSQSSVGNTAQCSNTDVLPRDHHGGHNPLKAFTSQGSVGKQFNAEGSVGSVPQKVGGALDKEGSVGKQFTKEGKVGGTVDWVLGEKK